nr:hypothetical protein [Streptomyces sp. TLI_235]
MDNFETVIHKLGSVPLNKCVDRALADLEAVGDHPCGDVQPVRQQHDGLHAVERLDAVAQAAAQGRGLEQGSFPGHGDASMTEWMVDRPLTPGRGHGLPPAGAEVASRPLIP